MMLKVYYDKYEIQGEEKNTIINYTTFMTQLSTLHSDTA